MSLRKIVFLFSGVGLFFVFVLFSYLVHRNIFQTIDFDTTVRLQDHISRRFDIPFSYLSLIGEFQYVAILLAIVLLIRRKIIGGLITFFLFGFVHIFELYGKIFVDHKPPPHFMLRTNIPVNLPQFYVSTQNSYPSGHAARAFFLTTVIFLITIQAKRRGNPLWLPKLGQARGLPLLCVLLGYDILMCISRVYLGEHWLSDVIGGSIIGTAFGLLSGVVL